MKQIKIPELVRIENLEEYRGIGNLTKVIFSPGDWFNLVSEIKEHNKLLAEGRVVYNNKNNNIGYIQAFHSTGDVTHMGFTHEAYLVGEKEIKKETLQDVVKRLLEDPDNNVKPIYRDKINKALGEGEE